MSFVNLTPFIWNKFNTATNVTSSDIGVNFTNTGLAFAPAKFGSGLSFQTHASTAKAEASTPIYSTGAITFVFKPNFNSSTVSADYPYLLFYKHNTNSSAIRIIYDQRSGHNEWNIYHPNPAGTGVVITLFTPSAFSANDKLFFCYEWDSGGLGGGANYRKLSIDGVEQSVKSGAVLTTAILASTMDTDKQLIVGNSIPPNQRCSKGVIDNFKIYPISLLTYERRFTEGIGSQKRRIA